MDQDASAQRPHLLRRLGVLDLTLITIGAVIGSGIFRNPAVVAQRAHTPLLIVATWVAGGVMAMIGAFVFAELANRRPIGGGFYTYLRDAYNPLVAFVLGWTVMMVAYTGSTAASAVLFASYVMPLIGAHFDARILAVVAIAIVTFINVLGVRQGSTWQNILVTLKVFGIAAVIVAGLMTHPIASAAPALADFGSGGSALVAFGFAMLPVLFAYNGFQSATYVTGEARDPARTVSRGQILGVASVVTIYVVVNLAYMHVLGANGLAATKTPAADLMNAALGTVGGTIITIAIAISTLGFMSGGVLLAPRLYLKMSEDGLFFKHIKWISPRTHTPVTAIVLHGAISSIIAVSGSFEQIVNWVTLPDWIFIGLAAFAIFIYRKREASLPRPAIMVPGHPWTTMLLLLAIAGVSIAVAVSAPLDALFGTMVLVTGAIFYYAWQRMVVARRSV